MLLDSCVARAIFTSKRKVWVIHGQTTLVSTSLSTPFYCLAKSRLYPIFQIRSHCLSRASLMLAGPCSGRRGFTKAGRAGGVLAHQRGRGSPSQFWPQLRRRMVACSSASNVGASALLAGRPAEDTATPTRQPRCCSGSSNPVWVALLA
jgi:hypothetical protein